MCGGDFRGQVSGRRRGECPVMCKARRGWTHKYVVGLHAPDNVSLASSCRSTDNTNGCRCKTRYANTNFIRRKMRSEQTYLLYFTVHASEKARQSGRLHPSLHFHYISCTKSQFSFIFSTCVAWVWP